MRRKMWTRCVLTVMVVGLSSGAALAETTTSGDADKSAEVNALNEEGAALYAQRDYRRAVERFLRAYAVDPDPNLLFNIARCYEKLGDTEAAIEKYEEFIALPGADTVGRSRAHQSLQALRQLAASQTQSSTNAAEQGSQPDEAPPADVAAPSDAGEKPDVDEEAGIGVWPWVTLGMGVAAAGAGGVFIALGQKDHDLLIEAQGYQDRSAPYAFTQARATELDDSGARKKVIGAVGLGVGGALLVTSAVLFWVQGGDDEAVRVGVDAGPSDYRVSVSGVF